MKVLLSLLAFAAFGCASPEPDDRGILHKTYALKHADADRVAQTLSEEEKGTPDHRVVIVADSNRNAVVVRGSADDHVRIEKRIRELDVR